MRLWSLHPRYLDAKGLVALWREALLARSVLRGKTRGYRHHPQLERFRRHPAPRSAISAYLHAVWREAAARGYAFARGKAGALRATPPIAVSSGQIAYEWVHLRRKLRTRDPARYRQMRVTRRPRCHPLFRVRPGPVAGWERT